MTPKERHRFALRRNFVAIKSRPLGPTTIFLILFSAVFITTAVYGAPQAESVAAPLPTPLVNARKVFISFAGQELNPRAGMFGKYSGGPDRTYNQFYAAMKAWGQYELVSAPADADLIFEIRFSDPITGYQVTSGSSLEPADSPHFRLIIRDPKSQVVLWAFTEQVESAIRQATRDKNFDQSLNALIADLKGLAARTGAPGGGAKTP